MFGGQHYEEILIVLGRAVLAKNLKLLLEMAE